ncbi:MAG: M20/M25/M40 family metallo-hydrolase, partial [Clostridia bacterium]
IKKCGKPNAKKLILDAHFDEIGFIVTGVFDDGFVSVTNVGGIDTRVLSASEVTIYGKKAVRGAFISKPPHLQTADEQTKKIELKDLYIDTGLEGATLKELVKVGDFADMRAETVMLSNNFIASKSLDDKVCIALILRALDFICMENLNVDVCCLFSGGEEVGYIGASTGAFDISPDYAIAIDVCNPRFPDGDMSREHIELSRGVVISFSGTTCRPFTKQIIACAEKNKIPFQIKADPGRTGTNAHVIAVSREGVPTILLSIPLRYMHTASEVVSLEDVRSAAQLVAKFAEELA